MKTNNNKKNKGHLFRGIWSFAIILMLLVLLPGSVAAAKKPSKVPGVCASYSGSKTISISWNKAKHAKKYEIYRSRSVFKGYKKVKTTKSLKWTDKNKSGVYYYKIRGVNGKKKGSFSPAVIGEFTGIVARFGEYNQRSLGLSGVSNDRDMGGYETVDGKTVKYNKILRTAKLMSASTADVKRLHDVYQLKMIFDFRSEKDCNDEADKIIPDATYYNIPIFEIPFSKSGLKIKKTSDKYLQYAYYAKGYPVYVDHYLNMYQDVFLSTYSQMQYRLMFDEILKGNGDTFLIHCAAGKDRTGVGAALILAALGVDRETITKDFGLSNVAYLGALSKGRAAGAKAGCNATQTLAVECRVAVSESRFSAAWDSVESEYGSMEEYLEKAIGLDEDKIALLRSMYTE